MVTFVLPVYNCYEELAANLFPFIQFLDAGGYRYKLVIVDDCSVDGESVRILAASFNCTYIRNAKNSGKGYSVKKGFEQSEGEYFIFMDGDFPFDLDVITLSINRLTGGADMVIGDRTLAQSSYPADLSALRRTGSRFLSLLMGRVIAPGYYDTQCGIKGFSRKCADYIFSQLTIKRFSFDIEILFLATRKKFSIEKIPVTVRSQQSSTVRVFKDGADTIKTLLVIYTNKILRKYSL